MKKTKEKIIEREQVAHCTICGNDLYRDDAEKWVYHISRGCVCKRHPGVSEWYDGLTDKAKQETKARIFTNEGVE